MSKRIKTKTAMRLLRLIVIHTEISNYHNFSIDVLIYEIIHNVTSLITANGHFKREARDINMVSQEKREILIW